MVSRHEAELDPFLEHLRGYQPFVEKQKDRRHVSNILQVRHWSEKCEISSRNSVMQAEAHRPSLSSGCLAPGCWYVQNKTSGRTEEHARCFQWDPVE